MEEGVILLSLNLVGEFRCSEYLYCLWNYFEKHYNDVRWFTSKWTLDHKRKKSGGGITSRLPYHFSFYTNPYKKITFLDNIFRTCISLSNELDEEYSKTNGRTDVVTLYIHGLLIFITFWSPSEKGRNLPF